MLRRVFAATSLVCVMVSLSEHARAAGAWVPSGAAFQPIEQRVAVAVGPSRTTVWTSLRFESATGPVGIVVPAPPGASLDFSSDAWFEALEVATAPRIFPPAGISPHCPGKSGPENVFEVAGGVGHTASLKVDDIAVLDDTAAVATWAKQGGLLLSPAVEASLKALSGVRFVGVRFQGLGGPAVTPTLRIAMPGAPPLPLSLTRAAGEDLRVTAWLIGDGRAHLFGTTPVTVSSESLTWDAKAQKSDYEDERSLALSAAGADGAILECASHDALSLNLSIAEGTASIDGLVTTFFERAAAYGDAAADPSSCVVQAAVALGSNALVSASCARADLGVVDGGAKCVEDPAPGEIDPAKLRCGGASDDLAVALSGLVPAGAWLNRQALQIPAGKVGESFALSFFNGASVSPVRASSGIDVGDCSDHGGGSSGGGMSSGSGAGSSAGSGAGPISSGGATGSGAGQSGGSGSDEGSYEEYDESYTTVETSCGYSSEPPETYDDTGDSCDSSETGGDSCDSSETGGDSCDSSETGGDSCDAGEGEDACSSGSYDGDTCDSGSSEDVSCDSGGGEDCAISGKSAHKRRAPRLSPIVLGALALLAPLRRRGRRDARRERSNRGTQSTR
jgi:hypothetical protein